MDNQQQEQPLRKRPRKANFSDSEVRVMLEEINIDHRVLFMANTQSVTNKVKARTWQKITEKVSACGVAVRSPQDVKDKWRSLKGAVLNKQRQRNKTGGGPEEKNLPYEEMILAIIGENSTLYTGIDVQGTETFNDVQYVIQETTDSQDTLQGTETFNDVQYVIQETMDSQDTSSVSTILYEPSSSYHYPGHSTPVRSPTPPPDTYQIRAENGEVFTIFEADDQAGNGEGAREAVGGASAGGGTCVTGGAKVSKGKGKGKSSHSTPVVAERSGRPNTETTLFDDYLRSEIAKNNAMTILLCNKNRKVLLEIANLESE